MKKLIFLLAIMFSFSCINADVTTEKVDSEQLAADLISASNDYQQAYITQDWDTASKWISSDLGTTIYNSNGSTLVAQDEQQVTNTTRGWDFTHLKCQTIDFMSSDMNTAVITFDADGLINFEDGEQNVGYAN